MVGRVLTLLALCGATSLDAVEAAVPLTAPRTSSFPMPAWTAFQQWGSGESTRCARSTAVRTIPCASCCRRLRSSVRRDANEPPGAFARRARPVA